MIHSSRKLTSEITEEEKDVLLRELQKWKDEVKIGREKHGMKPLADQAAASHVLIEDMHDKMFLRQDSMKKRAQRELREEIAHMTVHKLKIKTLDVLKIDTLHMLKINTLDFVMH